MPLNHFTGAILRGRTAGRRAPEALRKAALAAPQSRSRSRDRGNGKLDLREVRRRYNREYMRRWRTDPRNRLRNLEDRMRWYYERKVRDAMRPGAGPAPVNGKSICGFCHRGLAVRQVARLQVSSGLLERFVEVVVPYCGVC